MVFQHFYALKSANNLLAPPPFSATTQQQQQRRRKKNNQKLSFLYLPQKHRKLINCDS